MDQINWTREQKVEVNSNYVYTYFDVLSILHEIDVYTIVIVTQKQPISY